MKIEFSPVHKRWFELWRNRDMTRTKNTSATYIISNNEESRWVNFQLVYLVVDRKKNNNPPLLTLYRDTGYKIQTGIINSGSRGVQKVLVPTADLSQLSLQMLFPPKRSVYMHFARLLPHLKTH